MTTAPRNRTRRAAMVLLAVLVVIVVLSLAGYQYSDLMTAEYAASSAVIRDLQARAFAESGIQYAAAAIADPQNAGKLFDNPELFQGQIVMADSNGGQGCFSIVAPPADPASASANQSYRFGLGDETGKINVNALLKMDKKGTVAHDMLMKLPNMSDDVAYAILDWIDSDSDLRTGGAENETYGTMQPPYRAKNGPLDSIEELLLVRGITSTLLFGDDRNRNGLLDTGESQPNGWASYLTVYSREMNLDSQGSPRIDLNEKDLDSLYQKLSSSGVGDDMAKFIMLARQYGTSSTSKSSGNGSSGNSGNGGSSGKSGSSNTGKNGTSGGSSGDNDKDDAPSKGNSGSSKGNTGSSGNKSGSLGSLSQGKMNSGKQKQSNKVSSIYDLIDTQVSVPSDDPKGDATVYASPLNTADGLRQYLPMLLDKTTTSNKVEMAARININTAPDAVLLALPVLTDQQAQDVLAARKTDTADPVFSTTAWLSTEAKISSSTMKKLEPYITSAAQVYRFQSIGYFDNGGPVVRLEAVIDANAGRPRILFWRDLSELGKGYDVTRGAGF